ncbi:MAG: phosphonate C-P lyase system protein PhnH [Lachnospiraceae bacterium]|nr:phosphonate C-P lyase system protein PhnH [Lachnospiraceae bacterium]
MEKLHNFDEVYDSQKVFRIILEAMSNPARKISVKEWADKLYGENPVLLTVAMTLLDNEVSFNTCKDEALSAQISLLTHARETKEEDADYLFVSDSRKLSKVIEKAKSGTLADPHRCATIIALQEDTDECCLKLYGAGQPGIVEFHTSGTVRQAILQRDRQLYEYPEGIDFIFVSKEGNLFCIPRLTLMEEK